MKFTTVFTFLAAAATINALAHPQADLERKGVDDQLEKRQCPRPLVCCAVLGNADDLGLGTVGSSTEVGLLCNPAGLGACPNRACCTGGVLNGIITVNCHRV